MDNSLEELRRCYLGLPASKRYDIALQRLQYSECGPNRLIQCVSALEGFARSIALNLLVKKMAQDKIETLYEKIKNKRVDELIKEYICLHIGQKPIDLFGEENWNKLSPAIAHRNFLIHEAAFLAEGTSKLYIDAVMEIFEDLRKTFKIKKPPLPDPGDGVVLSNLWGASGANSPAEQPETPQQQGDK